MEQAITDFIALKRLPVIGVSRNERKFGNTIHKELKARGYKVFRVNPSMTEFHGERCYPGVSSLKGMVDGAIVCVSPKHVGELMHDASASGIRHLWLQQGAESKDSLELGRELGLSVVKGKCILMYLGPVKSVHNIHRFLAKITGHL